MNLKSLKTGSTISGDCENDPNTPPAWMDIEKFRRGQKFFQRHMTPILLAMQCFLAIGLAAKSLVPPLLYTTRKTNKAPKVLLRYMKIFVTIVLWHTEDVWDQNSRAHKSIQMVRKMHKTLRKAMALKHPGKLHVSQYDMAIVQYAFAAAVVTHSPSFGIYCTKREMEGYVFFWRVIGHILGMRDEYNACSGNYHETHRLFKEIEYEVLYSSLLEPTDEFEILANAYTDGVNRQYTFKLYTKESIVAFFFSITGSAFAYVELSFCDKLRFVLLGMFLWLVRWMPGFERLLNAILMLLFRHSLHLMSKASLM